MQAHDAYDVDWITKRTNGTTPSSQPAIESWKHPELVGHAGYADTDGDMISDAFEDLVGLNKNDSNDANAKPDYFRIYGKALDNRERTGGHYDKNSHYVGGNLTGKNLYTNLDFFADYLGGGLEILVNSYE